jgi:hypothetical protein
MQLLTGKSPGGTLSAAEWNQLPQEVQNVITTFGEVLSAGNLDQLGEAIALYSAVSQFYTCTGPVNAYIATIITGVQGPTNYKDGMIVRVRPNINNTSGSTINVNGKGIKTIVRDNGDVLVADDLDITRDSLMRYDTSLGKFRLSQASSGAIDNLSSPNLYIGSLIETGANKIRLSAGIGGNIVVNIDGIVLKQSAAIDFDISVDLDTGVTVANTPYYMYLENVSSVLTKHVSVTGPIIWAPNDGGNKIGYHPTNTTWKCVGSYVLKSDKFLHEYYWPGDGWCHVINDREDVLHHDIDTAADTGLILVTTKVPEVATKISLAVYGKGVIGVTTVVGFSAKDNLDIIQTPFNWFNNVRTNDMQFMLIADDNDVASEVHTNGILPVLNPGVQSFYYSNFNTDWTALDVAITGWFDPFAPKGP